MSESFQMPYPVIVKIQGISYDMLSTINSRDVPLNTAQLNISMLLLTVEFLRSKITQKQHLNSRYIKLAFVNDHIS